MTIAALGMRAVAEENERRPLAAFKPVSRREVDPVFCLYSVGFGFLFFT
jgi:hypothetical protein